ncbi:agamous-like MADS-box protein AGL80 [Malania oleifera]|uniref:agamous-like MADS-box protein AGL80 n=1 Tax=Malania oleifera TaxID=397392 RepID=UPI0025ADDB1E|nr:agamous-like MADS-box protein AGL80 [Malania oleifera]
MNKLFVLHLTPFTYFLVSPPLYKSLVGTLKHIYFPEVCAILAPFIMGRKKVKHELIANETARRTTFRKRKASLLKKTSELKILCGVEACAIIYDSQNYQLEVWPSSPEACRVLERFKDLPLAKQGKYMMDQEGFLKKNLCNLSGSLKKEKEKNRRLKMELLLSECLLTKTLHCLNNMEDMKEFPCFLEEKNNLITRKIESFCINPCQDANGKDNNNAV